MTKTKSQQSEAQKPLFDFLNSYDARLISTYTSKSPVAATEIRSYLINGQIVLVSLGQYGWDLHIPSSRNNNVAETLSEAAVYLGARPGDGHLESSPNGIHQTKIVKV